MCSKRKGWRGETTEKRPLNWFGSSADGEEMVEYMERKAERVSTLLEPICEQSKARHSNRERFPTIRESMKKEVKVEITHRNALIDESQALLVSLLSQRQV